MQREEQKLIAPVLSKDETLSANTQETISDRLIISLACGVGIALEEVDNLRVQILALAREHGLLAGEVGPATERSTIEVDVPDPPKSSLLRRYGWRALWATAAVILLTAALPLIPSLERAAKADRDWIPPGPPVTRVFKSTDGKFHVATVTRAQPGHPYVEVVMQRDIPEADVPAELLKIR